MNDQSSSGGIGPFIGLVLMIVSIRWMAFSGLAPGETSKPQTLLVAVDSNTGQSYDIVQELSQPLMSDEGKQLPESSFQCQVSGGQQPYATGASQMSAIRPGRQLLLQSGPGGVSSQFTITYQVQIPSSAPAGTYHSSVLLTVTNS